MYQQASAWLGHVVASFISINGQTHQTQLANRTPCMVRQWVTLEMDITTQARWKDTTCSLDVAILPKSNAFQMWMDHRIHLSTVKLHKLDSILLHPTYLLLTSISARSPIFSFWVIRSKFSCSFLFHLHQSLFLYELFINLSLYIQSFKYMKGIFNSLYLIMNILP